MVPTPQDLDYIREVNAIARRSAENGFDPFGAILVNDNQVVASSMDKCIQYSDPTAHAELVLISEYCRTHHLISLEGYTLYCNVEPCIMCSGAIHWARVSKLVFSVSQAALQSVSGGKVKPGCRDLINTGNKSIDIVGPVLAEEGLRVLQQYPFTSKKEKHRAFQRKKNERLGE